MSTKAYVTIWRVEGSDGIGPYRGIGLDAWGRGHDDLRRTPLPSQTFDGWYPDDEWKFGFSSPEQLFRWFTKKELSALLALGYSIVSLRVPESRVKHGREQVAFQDSRRFKSRRAA